MNSLLIPTRPHILKYLHFHLGESYFLSESDHIGLFLFHLLRRPMTDARRDHVMEDYESSWHVGLGSYGNGKWGFKDPTGKSVYQLNQFVHELMLDKFYTWVEVAVDHGQQAKFAIEAFMANYSFLEEDIQYDTLKKSWQRYAAQRRSSKKKVVSLTGRYHLKQLEKDVRRSSQATQRVA